MPKLSDTKKQVNKDKIIKVAKELFSENGYHLVSINDICRATQISKGAFYTYFESKENLFLDLAKDMDNRKISLKVTGNSLEEELLMVWDLIFGDFSEEDMLEYRMFFEFWMESYRINELHDILNQKSQQSFNLIKQIITRHTEVNLSDFQINMFVQTFWAQAEGLILYYLMHQTLPQEKEILAIKDFMKHYISYLSLT